VTLRTDVLFRSGFPDDTVEEDDDIVAWPGRNIMEALKAALELLGYDVSEPVSLEHAGWELDISRERKALWLRVNVAGAEESYLMAGSSTSWFSSDKKPLLMLLADLQRVLEADARFGGAGWFPRDRFDVTPASGPFEE
jgi:hypothetical protein